MDDIRLKYRAPIIIGTPRAIPYDHQTESSGTSFQDILQKQLQENEGVIFSKHAIKRVEERNISISDDSLARLNQGMRMASEKNLKDALILVDKTAFIVNVPSNTVITTTDQNDTNGNIFTNINGTVII